MRRPRKQRRGLIEAAHWAFGASGGAAFGALPRAIRRRLWAGPVYGLVVWLGFELGIAPVLGLSQAKRVRLVDRLALAADHLLYGLVLSGRARAREARYPPRGNRRGGAGERRRVVWRPRVLAIRRRADASPPRLSRCDDTQNARPDMRATR